MAKTINLNVEADTKEAEKNLEDVGEKAKDAAKQSEEIGEAAKKSNKGVSLLSKGFKGLGSALKAAGIGLIIGLVSNLTELLSQNQKVVDVTTQAFNALGIIFQQFTEPIITMVQSLAASGENFDALIRVGKAVLNIVFTPLQLAFKGIEAGVLAAQLAWEKSFFGDNDPETIEGLEKGLKQVKDDIVEIGEDAIESGKTIVNDFGEAFTEAGEIFTKTKDAIIKGYENIDVQSANNAAAELQRAQKQAKFDEAEQQRLIESFDVQAEKQRQLRDDTSLTIEERIAANEKLGQILNEQEKVEKENVKKRIANLQRQNELLGETEERNLEIFNLETELEAISARVEGQRSEQLTNKNSLLQEEKDLLNEIALIGASESEKAILEAEQELQRQQELINKTIANEQVKNERLLAAQRAYEEEVLRITSDQVAKEQKIKEDQQKAEENRLKAERDARMSNIQTVGTAIGQLGQLIGQNAQEQKGIAIAEAIISTYQGAAKAIGQGGIFGAVQAAGVIAAGLAQVRKIQQTEIPNASGSSGAPSIGGGGAVSQAPQIQNAFGGGNAQQVEVINTQDNTVRAYVLEGEVTSSQEAARRVERKSEL